MSKFSLDKFISNRYHFSIMYVLLSAFTLIPKIFIGGLGTLLSVNGLIASIFGIVAYLICLSLVIYKEKIDEEKESREKAENYFNNDTSTEGSFHNCGNGWMVTVEKEENTIVKCLKKDNEVFAKKVL